MPNAEKRAFQLSNLYYNQGLERAGVRDLTGAVTKLRQSLLLNKRNTQARNLLGLVYLEMGEAVAALREWLISQSYHPKNNPATDYIRRVQAARTRFQNMREAISGYNRALENCRNGNDDMAAVQLRRILSKTPGMIRAAQLLALIDIRQGKLGQARRVLRRVEKIDRTNPLTLRYLKEIEIQAIARGKGKKNKDIPEDETEQITEEEPTLFKRLRNLPTFSMFVNVLIGLTLGILAAAFLVVPAVKRSAHQEMNTRVLDYTTTLAEQKDRLDSLEAQIKESDAVVEKARAQVEDSQSEITSYDSLVKGYNYYIAEMYMAAAEELEKIDPSKLSTGAAGIYSGIYDEVQQAAYDEIVFTGSNAFYEEDYDKAIEYLERAVSIRLEDATALELLALSYSNSGDTQKAIECFEEIIQKFPNTWSADNAAFSIRMLGGETNYGMETEEGYTDTGADIAGDAYLSRQNGTEGYTDDVDLNAYTDNGYNENGYYEQDTGSQDAYANTGYIDEQGNVAQEYIDQAYANQNYTDPAYTDQGYVEGTDAQNGVLQQAYY